MRRKISTPFGQYNFNQRNQIYELLTLAPFCSLRFLTALPLNSLLTYAPQLLFFDDVQFRRDYPGFIIALSSRSFSFLSFFFSLHSRARGWMVMIEGCRRDRRSPLLGPWRSSGWTFPRPSRPPTVARARASTWQGHDPREKATLPGSFYPSSKGGFTSVRLPGEARAHPDTPIRPIRPFTRCWSCACPRHGE